MQEGGLVASSLHARTRARVPGVIKQTERGWRSSIHRGCQKTRQSFGNILAQADLSSRYCSAGAGAVGSALHGISVGHKPSGGGTSGGGSSLRMRSDVSLVLNLKLPLPPNAASSPLIVGLARNRVSGLNGYAPDSSNIDSSAGANSISGGEEFVAMR